MPQSQVQIQKLTMSQTQNLTPQQMLVVKLLEMPVDELEQKVNNEVVENVALEAERGEPTEEEPINNNQTEQDDERGDSNDSEDDYSSEAEANLERYGASDEELPIGHQNQDADRTSELPIGDTISFIEDLEVQMMDFDLTDRQKEIIYYLIGSLDNRGYIDKSVSNLTEELAFNNNMYDVEDDEVEQCLFILQQFDPAGIGARNSQECLLLQIDRQLNSESLSETKRKELNLARTIIADNYELFKLKNKERLKKVLNIGSVEIDVIYDRIKKLSIYPGLALCESSTDRISTQSPDFIVETDIEGNINMRLNYGELPKLHVSRDYIDLLKSYQKDSKKLSKGDKECMAFYKERVSAAEMFIDSIKIRHNTLISTMKAIIKLQKDFFLSKDINDKKRLVLNDVAIATGYDISTISRVCKTKSVELDGRIYPLSYFFKLTRTNGEGEEVDGRRVESLIKELVDNEDKNNPLSDDKIAELLMTNNINIARRTVAKYRNELGIPAKDKRKA